MIKKPPKKLQNRAFATMSIFSVCIVFLIGNLFVWQIVKGSEMQGKAVSQQLQDTTLSANRGTIYDRKGTILAESATAWNVILKPLQLKGDTESQTELNRLNFAQQVSELLQIDKDELYEKTGQQVAQIVLKYRVDSTLKNQLLELRKTDKSIAKALLITETTKRFYPLEDFASTVLGYVDADGNGNYGVEGYYNTQLKGVDGRILTAADPFGTDMNFDYSVIQDAENGNDLILTLDEGIQHFLENALDQAMEQNEVTQRACGIVMDVKNFEILAMSTRNGYDPNYFSKVYDEKELKRIESLPEEERKNATINARNEQFNNKTISFAYEPGSVFKIVTASAALDEGTATQSSTYDCPGYAIVNGIRIRCNNIYGHGHQTFPQALQNSCNPAFIKIGQDLGVANFCKYFRSFGFTEKSGIDLVGELQTEAGVHYHSESSMGIIELSSSSFGQSQTVTPIQMISAMAVVANGGYLGTPHVVKQVLNSDGNIVSSNTTTKRQVISQNTSDQMRDMLEKVVSIGGGKNAYIDGYRVAGKTGTSEKLGNEDTTARVASFCGFAPADDPQVACIIIIDEPRGWSRYGSVVAAPVFKQVMSDTLPYLGIQKSYKDGQQPIEYIAPDVKGMNLNDAKESVVSNGFKVRVIGEGKSVISQVPTAQTNLAKNSTIVLYTDEQSKDKLVTIPNLVGKNSDEINQIATELGVNIIFSGITKSTTSVCIKQGLPENTQVSMGTVFSVEFAEENTIE